MPDRILRSGHVWSEKLNGVSEPAALLFHHILTTADDFGLIDMTPGFLKMRCFPGRPYSLKQVAEFAEELRAAGLLRVYTEGGKTYAAVVKWNQTRWSAKPKFPPPPWGDEHVEGGYVAPRARLVETLAPPEKTRAPRTNGSGGAGFVEFYAAYPRHVARAAAEKAWLKLAPDQALQARILAAIIAQSRTEEWRKEGGKFIPHPATWLNARRWEDEAAPAAFKPGDRLPDGSIKLAL